jgi:hypothetical protein
MKQERGRKDLFGKNDEADGTTEENIHRQMKTEDHNSWIRR